MKSRDVEHFFVYGTLAPGRPNEHVLAELAGTWRRATVAGTLDERGWGAAQGFPGILLAPDDTGDGRAVGHSGADGDGGASGGTVEGLVFSSPDLGEHWARLDEFEGPEYERVTVRADLEDGSAVTAQVYALRG